MNNDGPNVNNYKTVLMQGVMGGSLLYEGHNTSSSQLFNGVNVAVRLGKVSRTCISAEQAVFTDNNESVEYGLLEVTSINH